MTEFVFIVDSEMDMAALRNHIDKARVMEALAPITGPHEFLYVRPSGAKVKIDNYRVTCDGAPLQIEGTLDNGRSFYFRARHRGIQFEIEGEQVFSVTSYVPDDPHIFSALSDAEWAVSFINGLLDLMKAPGTRPCGHRPGDAFPCCVMP